jgi:hypothetical protein
MTAMAATKLTACQHLSLGRVQRGSWQQVQEELLHAEIAS